MIRFDHVTFGYEAERPVLRELSLEIPEGGRVCLTGASGQGKTTALRLLLGLEQPQSGAVIRPEGTRFSVVFQEDRLLPWKTALENAALTGSAEDARCWLTELGLGGSLDALPETLSGGMKRRAALARALAHPFDVLVLDEALTGLDDAAKANPWAFGEDGAAGVAVVSTGAEHGAPPANDSDGVEAAFKSLNPELNL